MDLSHRIEKKRSRMLEVAKREGLNLQHPDVLRASQELDVLLVAALKEQMRK